MLKQIPQTDLDYVEFYASKMKEDNNLFEQQKNLIESQMKSSRAVFRNLFSDGDFKLNARSYLRKIGLIK